MLTETPLPDRHQDWRCPHCQRKLGRVDTFRNCVTIHERVLQLQAQLPIFRRCPDCNRLIALRASAVQPTSG